MAFNIGGQFEGGYGEIKPGYESPFGKNAPSVKGNYDWSGASKVIYTGNYLTNRVKLINIGLKPKRDFLPGENRLPGVGTGPEDMAARFWKT
jgi:hypothetical protein